MMSILKKSRIASFLLLLFFCCNMFSSGARASEIVANTDACVTSKDIVDVTDGLEFKNIDPENATEPEIEGLQQEMEKNETGVEDGAVSQIQTAEEKMLFESSPSGIAVEESAAGTSSVIQVQATEKLSKLTGFAATAYSYKKVKLSWVMAEDADYYRIYRSETKTGGYVSKAKISALKNTYIDKNVETGKLYYYKIRYFKSGIKSAAVRTSCKTFPKIPTGLTLVLTKKNKVKLTWNAVPNAQQYEIFRSVKKSSGYKKIKTVTKLRFTNLSVKGGKTYYYKVRAVSNGTAGKVCKCVSIAVPAATPVPTVTPVKKKTVIVLDPGHGGWDSGACYYGYKEEDLVLEIATYVKQELSQYSNVEVYLTRTSDWTFCNEDKAKDFKMRAEFAKSKGADAFISIHLNASENLNANGAEVYASVNQKFYADGDILGNLILNQLSTVGVSKRGIVHRMSGTTPGADYYGIIRNGVANDMLSIIIEHCFLSNSSDVSRFLSTPAARKKLGQADARAIAAYYNLSK